MFADDSDNDGLEDAWEGTNFGNLLQTADGDPDTDFLTNILEQTLGSDPNLNDTDSDGYLDGVEYQYGTSPISADSYPTGSLLNITLVEPSFGVSAVAPFDMKIKTLNKSSCKYSTDPATKYEDIDSSVQFFSTENGYTHIKEDFPAASYIETPIYVFCKTESGYVNDGFPAYFTVGVDNTEPVMLAVYADPANVIEKLEVDLVAETDDDTACRYLPYDTKVDEMDTVFDDADISEFKKKTVLKLTEDTNPKIEDQKSYIYIVVCMNKAESMVTGVLEFNVDLSVGNEINETFPSGLIKTTSTEVRVVTNKDSTCYYGETFLNKFSQENKKVHFIQKTNLSSGEYNIPVKCRFADATIAETTISFIVDTVKPEISKLEVGSKQCNNSVLYIDYLAKDANQIQGYYVKLLDDSNNVLWNTTTTEEEVNLTGLNLDPDKKYYVELEATDKAGNAATEKSSEITVLAEDDPTCKNIPPKLQVKKSELTESLAKIYLDCSDEDGRCFPIYYHVINDSCTTCGDCDYVQYNNLLPVVVEDTTEICYNISDDKKYVVKDSFEIKFETCKPETDTSCCNERKVSVCLESCETISTLDCDLTNIDTDGDGISDVKEEQCGLDPTNPDDADLDPDNDGLTNGEECNYGTNMEKEDTDNDGYTDMYEVQENTDPNDEDDYPIDEDTDTDDDGIPDMFERRFTFLNPKDADDAEEDEDGDGLTNLQEYRLETDLDDSDSDNDGFTDYEEYNKKTDPKDDEDYPKNYFFQILFFILGIGSLTGGLIYFYKNPIKSMKLPKSSGMVNFDAAKNNMQKGMSVQPPPGLQSSESYKKAKGPIIDKSNLDHEIRKQKDMMKLKEMSSIFDQFAEEDVKPVKQKTIKQEKEEKKQKKLMSRLEDISEEDPFEEIERIGKK